MLNQKFFGLSLTTWIVIIIILIYSIYLTKCDMENFSANSDIEDNSDFEDNSDVDSTVKVYNFNTRWCGYSKQFQPTWDAFSKKNNGKNDVEILDVKCDDKDDSKAQSLCQNFDVPGYPTVIFQKGEKKINYEGERTVEAMEEFLKKIIQ